MTILSANLRLSCVGRSTNRIFSGDNAWNPSFLSGEGGVGDVGLGVGRGSGCGSGLGSGSGMVFLLTLFRSIRYLLMLFSRCREIED